MTSAKSKSDRQQVFINCPFDEKYIHQFDAILFTILACRCVARCALEIDDGSEVRIEKIFKIIEQCQFGIHDLSRTELDTTHLLPRFNMPLEFGIFLGAKRFGTGKQKAKSALILDTDRFRYQKFISDIAGQDIKAHGGRAESAIAHVRNWLSDNKVETELPGDDAIAAEYAAYMIDLPKICAKKRLNPAKLTFNDKANAVHVWLAEQRSR